jgi:hypothetical protein
MSGVLFASGIDAMRMLCDVGLNKVLEIKKDIDEDWPSTSNTYLVELSIFLRRTFRRP